jgi:1-acyl-sn-glycerol-3-phosphate acyltransferase
LPGTAALYRALGAPCIPVALNSGLFWPRRGFVRRPGTIVLEYLPPIPPGLRRREFMALLEERIETASTALIAPTEPGTRAA